MKKYSVGGILVSLLLVFSIFTLLSISEANAEQHWVDVIGYENTVIMEFENESASKIKTVRIWLAGDTTFTSFKTEPGWGGGKYSEGKMIIFTATNTLNPGELVKFGFTTSEKVDAINWKTLDQNEKEISAKKTSVEEISKTISSYAEQESEFIEEALKETEGTLYGTKKFIPEKIRVGSDIRLAGNGFNPDEDFKLYLDTIILKSIKTDKQGNFLTTITIPDTITPGTSEFIIKDESENIQITNINIGKAENRFLKTTKFVVNDIPAEVRYDETLTISGNAYPQSAVILEFEDMNRVLEKTRVVKASSNGEWVFEEMIDRTETIGEKYVIIQNNKNKTTKNLNIQSDYVVQISTAAIRYSEGDTVSITGTAEPNENTTMWIKDGDGKIIHYDVFTSQANGNLNYGFPTNDIPTGTYTVIIKQKNGSDATIFGIGKYPTPRVVTMMAETNFMLNSQAMLSIVGPPSSNLSIKILDSNDNIVINDSIITSAAGKSRYAIDLVDLSSGIYRAVVSSINIQDSIKFSVGLEAGSGQISLLTIQEKYSPGDSILVLGTTGVNARLTITLYDPSGNVSNVTEIFSDGSGGFSTSTIGIPTDADYGDWKITAHSRLDTTSITINVSIPKEKSITLEIEDTEFKTSQTVIIKGLANSDTSRLVVKISDVDDEVLVKLETPITSDSTFSLPWVIPNSFDAGLYTITVSDGENSDSVEIFVE